MIKNDLIETIIKNRDCSYMEAREIADTVIGAFCKSIERREDIFIRGFGTFKVVKRKQRPGRDIRRGTTVEIPERHTVKFIPSKELKNKLK